MNPTSVLFMEMARKSILESIPKDTNISPEEIDYVIGVCMLGVYRTGNENPKAMLGIVSNELIEHMVKHLQKAKEHKDLAKGMQFFLLEWCWRNDYLNEDWRWEWINQNEGKIHFNARLPLEMIPIPSD